LEKLPKPYTKTTVPELESITLLEYLLDKTYIKSHIAKYDKVPNHDGKIEVTNVTQHFLGEFSVQVKTMNKEWGQVFYFEDEFLSYCKYCLLPVLIFLCDKDKQQVFWRYIGPTDIEELERQRSKSVVVRFNKDHVISKIQQGYLKDWDAILKDERERKVNRDTEKRESEKLRKQLINLKKLKDHSYQKRDSSFVAIHDFLDYYNGLLDNEFKTIKEIFYPDIWKIGIAIEEYSNNRLQFIKYPVPRNQNDTLIKVVKTDNKAKILDLASSYIGYHKDNPIKFGSHKLAHDLIGTDLNRAIDEKYLAITHPIIAREILIQFIDDFYLALGLKPGLSKYNIDSVEQALHDHVGLLFEELHIINKSNAYNPAKLEHIWFANYNELAPFLAKAKERMKRNETILYNFHIYSDNYDVPYIIDLLWSLRAHSLTTIDRLYHVKQVYFKRPVFAQTLTDEQIKADLEIFYNNLHEVYDYTIKGFFPALYSVLNYFKEYQKLIILWGSNMKPTFEKDGKVEVNIVKLSDMGANLKTGVEFIHSNSHPDQSLNKEFFLQFNHDPIIIAGIPYQRISVSTRSLNMLNRKMPLYNAVYEMLKDRLTAYLKDKP